MNSSILLFLFITVSILIFNSNAKPIKPVAIEVDPNGNPILFMRTRRHPVPVYPHKAMMLTGFYRPVRYSDGSQGSGVFAQGNAVSGGAYFGAKQPNYLQQGAEPAEESEISSAEAEAAPEQQNAPAVDEEDQRYPQNDYEEESGHHQLQEDVKTYLVPPNKKNEPSHPTKAPVGEEPDIPKTSVSTRPSKVPGSPQKRKKTTVQVEDDDQADEDDNEDEDDAPVPFVPFKANRRNNIPNLNNFFPMIFSLPKSLTRSGSSDSPPGMITAIANSYSTGKGGVASSVATAYGGSPNGKKKRNHSNDE